jgi:FAD-linked oxidoreductase
MTSNTRAWTNWARNQSTRVRRVVAPRDAAEVAREVRDAAADGLPLRAVGAGHAFSAAAVTDGVLLRTDGLRRMRSIDARGGLVTVEAGMSLRRLNELLAEQGLAMSCLGDCQEQTVAGAVCVGMHGTGRARAGLADAVRAVELVLADGTLLNCSPTHEPEAFEAARLGLGAIGVLTAVTLATEPAYLLASHEEPRRFDDVLADFDELTERHEHCEVRWIPYTSGAVLKWADRGTDTPAGTRAARAWLEDRLHAGRVFGATGRLGRSAPQLTPLLNRISARTATARSRVDRPERVLCAPRHARYVELEYALPRTAMVAALREIRTLIQRSDWCVGFPVTARTAPADQVWLSPAYGRDTGYLALRMSQDGYQDCFTTVEDLLVSYDGRPHWGTLHGRDADFLADSYPRFADFRAVRDRVDPGRLFRNPYTTRVLGG